MSEEEMPRTHPGSGQDKELTGEQLFARLYAELHRLAERELIRHRGMTVSATTLVHEAYVNLSGREGVRFADRGKFLGYAARAMRGLLIDLARRRQALKLAEVVDLKYFCGFSFAEIAGLRGISERTVQRDWEKARLILFKHIGAGDS
jgi:DNA-directed RNA polymerase specialized sigma24 family protein